MPYTRIHIAFSVLLAISLIAQHFYWPQGFGAVIGSWLAGYGFVGMIRRKIAVGHRGGYTNHTGVSAYLWSVIYIALGAFGWYVALFPSA